MQMPKLFRLSLAVSSLCFFCDVADSKSIKRSINSQRIHDAALRLRDDVFDKCIVKMSVSSICERNGNAEFTETGTLVFARYESSIFSDTATTKTFSPSQNGRKAPRVPTTIQFFMANGQRCIGVNYNITKSGKTISTVSCETGRNFDEALITLTRYVYLSKLIAEFNPTGSSLVDITRNEPESIRSTPSGDLTAKFATEFGTIELDLVVKSGKDAISAARILQTPSDIYTVASKVDKLSSVSKSIVGETPNGITSVLNSFSITFGEGSKPFSTIIESIAYVAEGKSWKVDRTMKLIDYRKCNSEKDVQDLRIIIPEGETVQAYDPEYQSLALAYRGGQVVRQVDGKSLDEVIATDRKRSRLTSIVLWIAGCFTMAVAIGLVMRWRLRRRAAKVVSP